MKKDWYYVIEKDSHRLIFFDSYNKRTGNRTAQAEIHLEIFTSKYGVEDSHQLLRSCVKIGKWSKKNKNMNLDK